MARPLAAVSLMALLTACAGGADGGAGSGGLERTVAGYYAAHASEERGVCSAPYMDAITRLRTVEEDADERTVQVRYRYRDWVQTGAENRGTCEGFGERTFALAGGPEGWRVTGMSGPTRGRS